MNTEEQKYIQTRAKAIGSVARLLERLADPACDYPDLRRAYIEIGEGLNANTALLLMACNERDFEAGKNCLAMMEAIQQGQPIDELRRLHGALGAALGGHAGDAFGLMCAATDIATDDDAIGLLMAARSLEIEDFDYDDCKRLAGTLAKIIRSFDPADCDGSILTYLRVAQQIEQVPS